MYSEQEIDALLQFCILQTALKYNKISSCFKYCLKAEIVALTKDTLTHRTTMHLDIQAEYECHKLFTEFNTSIIHEKQDYEKRNEFVLEGSTLEGFSELTDNERAVAAYIYLDRYKVQEVANLLTLSIEEVRNLKKSIIQKLEQYK